MQKLKQGLVVSARRRRWRIEDLRPFPGCDLVVLVGVEPSNVGQRRSVLSPFDALDPIEPRAVPKRVRLARWRRACRALLAANTPPGGLRAAASAAIDVFPHQLAPALAIVRGLGARVLLADDVGLGKTMEAALVVAELRARGAAGRVLVLTPAGLRDQWREELMSRLDIAATVLDAVELRRLVASLPHGVNPWATVTTAIASLDFVKRAEVLPAASECYWDVVIVDEAHGLAADSDRRHAAHMLARRALYVLLLSATPHNGDRNAFASLCRVGGDEPILLFRRTRDDVALGTPRKVTRLAVRGTEDERRMHRLLARFIDAVARERGEHVRLVASVLQKRGCSSARSLEQSVERRLSALGGTGPRTSDDASQLALPLAEAGEVSADDEAPPWPADVRLDDWRHEQRMLEPLAAAARAASRRESKIAAVERLLGRIREPAIVFTEYRDTLLHIAARLRRPSAVLHGGLTRHERAIAIAGFVDGRFDLLLATDAAGEGLNLQQRCRLVVNLELPWNPMRLEQRIGRVDRIGQRRTVHVIHLLARETGEVNVLQRLHERITRAQRDVGAADPLGGFGAVRGPDLRPCSGHPERESRGESAALQEAAAVHDVDLRLDCEREAERITATRRLCVRTDITQLEALGSTGPWIATARRTATRAALAGRTIVVFQSFCTDGAGRIVESTITGLSIPPRRDCRDRGRLVARLARDPQALDVLHSATAMWCAEALRIHSRFVACRLARERARSALCGTNEAHLTLPRHAAAGQLQPGLFDRRAEAASQRSAREHADAQAAAASRLAALEAAADVHASAPRLLLVLEP